jgi:hypothetical protein
MKIFELKRIEIPGVSAKEIASPLLLKVREFPVESFFLSSYAPGS